MAHTHSPRDRVIIPAYFRPEFLYLTLEKINEARDSDKDIYIYHDKKFDDDIRFAKELEEVQVVIEYWRRAFGNLLHPVMRQENRYYGNSANVFQAYLKAHLDGVERVYLIEDDVLITPDFFEWHKSVQDVDCFCTIAGMCDRNIFNLDKDFLSTEYASLGVCWKRENLTIVLEHANENFYRNPTPYILTHFKDSKMGLKMMEQDGVIQRIAEQRFQKFLFAVPQKAYHIGAYGYHRSIGPDNMPTGTLPERIEFFRKVVSDQSWFDKVADFQTDLQAFPILPQLPPTLTA